MRWNRLTISTTSETETQCSRKRGPVKFVSQVVVSVYNKRANRLWGLTTSRSSSNEAMNRNKAATAGHMLIKMITAWLDAVRSERSSCEHIGVYSHMELGE